MVHRYASFVGDHDHGVRANGMKAEKLLNNVIIILTGPAITVMLYVRGEAGNLDAAGVGQILIFASVLTIVGSVFGVLAHLRIRQFWHATLVSVILSEVSFVVLLVGFVWFMPEGANRADFLMWLPIMLVFMIYCALPTALSVSCGMGRIIRDIEGAKRTQPVAPRDRLYGRPQS